MKKILLVDKMYPLNTRNERLIMTLRKKFKVNFIAWDRESNCKESIEDGYIFSSFEGYGNKIKKIIGMRKYFKFLKEKILENKPDILICSHWDMLLLCKLMKYKGKILYENLDLPTSKNKIILFILLKLEKILVKNIDGILFASRFFVKLYDEVKCPKLLIENLPLKKITKKIEIKKENPKNIRISFIGSLRYFDDMKKLLEAIQKIENVEVYLIGKGAENEKFKKFIINKKLKRVFMMGDYNYEEIARYYQISDFIWAVYPANDYNVKYAISNKFHESIIFEKICFFSKNTLLGEYVDKNKIGISINSSNKESIEKTILNILNHPEKIVEITENIKKYKQNKILYWEENEENLIKFIEKL
ncbi:glycosyltransferase [Fusobacterium sp. FSA-380-WT-2B]|uniref:glycosyltransferase n=1 Tax=Fusobacterium sp. FSA-380-WT-2B TaxID=2605786 RepID=UPI0012B352A2|nr:glycosyltransferase [Fusobacterium sp. FSA-380-WT-2B]MSS61775.1 glycosyltransferase family 4 protein [Fusobacterium sp. FSA-380-WT-2B]